MMQLNRLLAFLPWILAAVGAVNGASGKTCTVKDQCSCQLNDGSKISLWPIDRKNGPRFEEVIPGGFTFQYSPCTPFSPSTSPGNCHNSLICRTDTQTLGSQKISLAFPETMVASYDGSIDGYTFSYTGSKIDQNQFKSIVKLKCDKNAETPTVTQFIGNSNTYTTTLTSKYACPIGSKGLSAGSVLCIVFFSVVLVYLIGGILINKFIFHKEGSDVVPQKTFWIHLPSYAKDGFVFTFRTVRGKGSQYEKL